MVVSSSRVSWAAPQYPALGWHLLSQLSQPSPQGHETVAIAPAIILSYTTLGKGRKQGCVKKDAHSLCISLFIPRSSQRPHPLNVSLVRRTITCTPHTHSWQSDYKSYDCHRNIVIHLLGPDPLTLEQKSQIWWPEKEEWLFWSYLQDLPWEISLLHERFLFKKIHLLIMLLQLSHPWEISTMRDFRKTSESLSVWMRTVYLKRWSSYTISQTYLGTPVTKHLMKLGFCGIHCGKRCPLYSPNHFPS